MNVTRRRFLQGVGGCAGAALVAVPRGKVLAETFPGNPERYGVLTDTTMCIGCRVCELACAEANGLPKPDISDRSVFQTERRTHADAFTVVNAYQPIPDQPPIFRKVQCMHCDEPACVSACLVGAFKKTPEGPVVYDESVCIGCRYCMNACPFTMPAFEYDDALRPAIRKCMMCYQNRVSKGIPPACVEACPSKASIFGKRSDLIALAKQRIKDNPGRYHEQVYGEAEVGGTGWLYLSAVPFDQLAMPVDLGNTPYPELTRDWLLGVPIVLMLWPALLMGIHAMVKHKEEQGAEQPAESEKGGKLQ